MNIYLERYIENLTGRTFIKSVAQIESKLLIFFYNSYKEFTEDKETKITEEDYLEYFSQNSIEKILVGEPARILREFPFIDSVEIRLLNYTIELNRDSLNEFLGFRIELTNIYDGSWRDQFSDVYIYNKTNRKQLFDKFVSIES